MAMEGTANDDCHTAVQHYNEFSENVHDHSDLPNLPHKHLAVSGQILSSNEAE